MVAAMETLKQRLQATRKQLQGLRSPHEPSWRDVDQYILPDRCQWTDADSNQPNAAAYSKIIDGTPVASIDTLAAGLHSRITSPARPWFALALAGMKSAQAPAAKAWLDDCRDRMLEAFTSSNLYNALPITYGNCAAFGIDAVVMEEDDDDVFRFENLAIGTYWVSTNSKRRVDCIVREIPMTVRQMVERFGIDQCSDAVKAAWNGNQREAPKKVVHIVCPNEGYNPRSIASEDKRYLSAYYEDGSSTDDKFLSKKGFDTFPVLCPRWEVIGRNAYGQGPGKKALGDAKALQAYERRSATAVAKMLDPPMQAPSSMSGMKINQSPGAMNFYDEGTGKGQISPMYERGSFDLGGAETKAEGCRQRVRTFFFVDLFLALSASDRRQITAEEIRAKQEELVLRIGPVLENLNDELLDPLIDRAFQSMMARGLLPPPPREIQGMTLVVQYVSTLAQVQKTLGLGAMDRFIGTVGNMAGIRPDVLDNINSDKVVAEVHDMLGVTHRVLNTDEERQAIRDQRAQAAAKQQQQADLAGQAQTAELLSKTNTRDPSALTDIIRAQSGGIAA